ncbi:hypothetical protein [Streptomyces catenulae]|uniref:Integral membrane protein n=1 Tax=Streptomyces catenulae TaxID=66875 RepID=A0ABV2Z6R3_9ACTN|nr:hypothetical protein [Streptomyces catenulae]
MNWSHDAWLGDYLLPAVVSAALAWIGLAREFTGKGRLLGSWASFGLMVTVLTLMGAVATGAVLLLPHAASIPPVVAGAATGAAALPRRKQDEVSQSYVRFMTLGIALVKERLAHRMNLDACTWVDRFLDRVHTSTQLRIFAHDLKLYLLERHRLASATKTINGIYSDVKQSIDSALDVQTRIDEECRQDGRARTEDEIIAQRQEFGTALAHCGHLLRFAYVHGRRSEDTELCAVVAKAMSPDAFSSQMPTQRRWFERLLTRGQHLGP